MAFDQNKYNDDYTRENYDRLSLKIPKGKKEILRELAKEHNIVDDKGKVSITRLLMESVEQVYGVDLTRSEKPD